MGWCNAHFLAYSAPSCPQCQHEKNRFYRGLIDQVAVAKGPGIETVFLPLSAEKVKAWDQKIFDAYMQEKAMKAPTEAQLNDPKWWDENAPSGCENIGVAYIDGKVWSYEYMMPGVTAMNSPCNAEVRFFCRPKKPTKKERLAPEWDGEGLPPAGCECEYDLSLNSWAPAQCIAIGHDRHEPHAVIQTTNRLYLVDDVARLRPLRTKEQRERDEVIDWTLGFLGYRTKNQSPVDEAIKIEIARLYDAGLLRKGE